MAIYRLEAKIISRGKEGHSAVAAAAYRTGTKIRDERSSRVHDYSNRTKGVVESVILRPENSPEWTAKTSSLWNEVERHEKRKDSQLAREFILALPRELSGKEQFECAVGWAQQELVGRGMVAEVSLHDNGKGNPHCHILCTMRTLEGDKFSAKKPREWNDKTLLFHWRESWAGAVNGALEKANRPERVDHRSLEERGIDRIPEPKIGKDAMGMKKRGVVEDPERHKLVRWVRSLNAVKPWLKAIERIGEIRQEGMGKTWWERSIFMAAETTKTVKDAFADTWEALSRSKSKDQTMLSPPKGPDLDMSR